MYKYLSILLAGCLLFLGCLYLWQRHVYDKTETELNNKIAKLEGTVKETETAYSVKAQEVEDLKVKNEDLKKLIKNRDEEVAALGKIVLEWKGKYFKILDAYQSIVDNDGNPVPIEPDCVKCLENKRFKVEFDQTQNYLRVKGFTLTNPPVAELDVSWTRNLILNLILTKDENKNFRIYVDSSNSDIVPSTLELKVDPSVFAYRWYEKMSFSGSLHIGDGAMTSVGVGYDILNNWRVGPSLMVGFTDSFKKFYGIDVLWYPFRR